VTGSHTYTDRRIGFQSQPGAPVVTINGLAVTLKSFRGSTIVGTLATAVTGDYTAKITNSKRQSSANTVAEPSQKADSRNTKNKSEGWSA
jgi:hypothetical protein